MVFFVFLFRFFFKFWAKIFQTFGQKTSRSCQNYLLRVQTNNFWVEETFKSFEPFWFFCKNLWSGSQNSIYVSRVKFPEETVFLNFSFRIFSNFEQNIFRLLAEKLQDVFKTNFYVSRGTVCGLNFFLKFWIVLGFLQKPLAWFSKFYLRVQSKNSGRNNFFILLFRIFSDFERKFFQIFGQKLQEVFKTTFYVSRGTVCGLKFFKKFWIVLDLLQKPLAWFSKFYLRVQSKNCGRKIFFFFFLEFYRILSEKFFRLLAKKLQEVFRTTFYVSRRKVCGLKFFWKFWIVLDFLQKPLAWFSKFCLRVQSTNSGRNNFFNSSFQSFFSDFERNIFQTFDEKPSRSCQIYLLRVQRNSL